MINRYRHCRASSTNFLIYPYMHLSRCLLPAAEALKHSFYILLADSPSGLGVPGQHLLKTRFHILIPHHRLDRLDARQRADHPSSHFFQRLIWVRVSNIAV